MTARGVIIVGAGGHAKVLASALRRMGRVVVGMVDADSSLHGREIGGCMVLGDDSVLDQPSYVDCDLVNGLGGVGVMTARRNLQDRLTAAGRRFATVIDPSAVVACDVVLGEGVQIMAGAVVQVGCRLGKGVIVNTRASIDHDCRLEDYVHAAPGVVLSGDVRVGSCTLIGVGAAVIQGVEIGELSVVGAGAAVVFDLPRLARAVGVPARDKG